jgi:hypothetical protein
MVKGKQKAQNGKNQKILPNNQTVSSPIPVGISYVEHSRRQARTHYRTGKVTERVGSVRGIATSGFGLDWVIPVNPGVLLDTIPFSVLDPLAAKTAASRLATMSSLYNEFRIHGLKVHYIPAITTFSNGEVIITYDTNPMDDAAENDVAACQHIHVATQIYNKASLDLDDCVRNEFPRLFTRGYELPLGTDQKTYDAGVIHVYTNGATSALCGHIELEYDFSFYSPDNGNSVTGESKRAITSYQFVGDTVTQVDGNTELPMQQTTLLTNSGHVVDVGVKTNGGTTPLKDCQVYRFNEAGVYEIQIGCSAQSTSSPLETSLSAPFFNVRKSENQDENPDLSVYLASPKLGAWEKALGSVQQAFGGWNRLIVDVLKGQVLRFEQNLSLGMTANRFSGLANVLSFEKISANVLGLFGDVISLRQLSHIQGDRVLLLQYSLKQPIMAHPLNRAIKHRKELELAKLLSKQDSTSRVSSSSCHTEDEGEGNFVQL